MIVHRNHLGMYFLFSLTYLLLSSAVLLTVSFRRLCDWQKAAWKNPEIEIQECSLGKPMMMGAMLACATTLVLPVH